MLIRKHTITEKFLILAAYDLKHLDESKNAEKKRKGKLMPIRH